MNGFETSSLNSKIINEVFDNTYFKINKILQELIGIWPYQKRFDALIKQFIVILILSMVAMPHINGIRVWCGKDLGLCAENLAGVTYASGVCTKYFVVTRSKDQMTKVYEKITSNWLTITDPDERVILNKFALLGKYKSIGYVGYITVAAICFSQLGLLPILIDVVLPLQNGTREKLRVVKAEFGVDPYDYYWHIYGAYCAISVVSSGVLMAIDTSYTAVVHQNLAIFNIVKYRLTQAKRAVNTVKDVAYEQIISAIRLHQDSLEFNNLIEHTYDVSFLILILICVTFLTFGAITIMEESDSYLDMFRLSLLECGVCIHLFYLSWPGQLVVTESEDLYYYTYNNEWYNLSEKSKTLLKFMMLRCMKPCCLTAAGLYVMNFENYGAIIKSTVSYITVVASFRED
ncbi:odorant receptor 146 isoform X2 [Nasonia vitripennis]|uniref:Odorant receptor n=2 Tax=Nasonia vitripennis TaxID=7425 RepID=A0A7M7QN80_NASVI|nr:odorant receptor 146 [Nasonia vitripennis]XP_032452241.1 odorant receptor 146 isoform X2 [Nasonia vitripennis]